MADDNKTARQARVAQSFVDHLPHSAALNMAVDGFGPGWTALSMPYDPALVGDPDTGVIHGGAVSVLLDTCGGAAVLCHDSAPGGTATLDLRIDYMRPATPGQRIRARAECYHMTRTVAFIRAVAMDDDDSRPVATATGAFTVEGRS
jgi:uncharacterized protein (TIGR00369 family)